MKADEKITVAASLLNPWKMQSNGSEKPYWTRGAHHAQHVEKRKRKTVPPLLPLRAEIEEA